MVKILDVTNANGQLAILGGAMGLPTSAIAVSGTIVTGSIRYNTGSTDVEVWNGSAWVSIGSQNSYPYDIYGTFLGQPNGAQMMWRIVVARTVILPVSLTGSQASCLDAPTGSITCSITQNGSQKGTINFAASATTGTFTFASQITLSAGDILEVIAPVSNDPTFATPSWAFVGTRN